MAEVDTAGQPGGDLDSNERAADGSPAFFVHPKGLVESDSVGEGTRVWAFAHVLPGAVVGAHCNIGECAFIETGARLGNHVTVKNGVQVWAGVTCEDYVFVGPNATFTNDLRPRAARRVDPADFARTRVGYGASIGANATVVGGTTLGIHCLAGAGSVITQDVPDYALVVGNPARRVGWVCECGQSLNKDLECTECGKFFESCSDLVEGIRPGSD